MLVVTFTDRPPGPRDPLAASCARHGVELHVVQRPGRWTANALKLGMLARFLEDHRPPDDEVVFILDALDVVVEADPARLLNGFGAMGADVVFGAEANFYFADRAREAHYRAHSPVGDGPYRFLNSGTIAARAGALREATARIQEAYAIDLADDGALARVRSDQLLFTRLYVDVLHGAPGPRMALDHRHALFACTGGRMFVHPEAPPPGPESFLLFRLATRRLRHLRLLDQRLACGDLTTRDGVVVNRLTNTRPAVVHLPGTHSAFPAALARLRGGAPTLDLRHRLAAWVEDTARRDASRLMARAPRQPRHRWDAARFRWVDPPCAVCRPPTDAPPTAACEPVAVRTDHRE